MSDLLLLPAYASHSADIPTHPKKRDPSVPVEWKEAIEELGEDSLGELLSGEFIVIPSVPKNGIAALPPSTPYPKNGIKPLPYLSLRNRRILALHMKGWKSDRIALALDLAPNTITAVLRNPTTQAVISDLLLQCDDELRALAPLAVDRLRETLERPSTQSIGLSAVDLFMKASHRYKEAPGKAQTAEDVIQEILKIRTEGAAEIEIGRREVKRK